ncbi:hypothetical protein [Streptomyces xiamenensis]|uniref:hypothetical protein n=1 Tax=Streptomyces xiamenensis TaxID=408015 RepID=UPI0011D183F9
MHDVLFPSRTRDRARRRQAEGHRRGRYSGDYRAAGLAHAHLVTSTVARGTLTGIDTAAALASPGVLRVYAAPDPRLGLASHHRPARRLRRELRPAP